MNPLAFCGVYCLVNTVSRRMYVGSGVNIRKRLRGHFWSLRINTHKNRHLQASFNKYGLVAFQWFVLEACDPSAREDREQFWMDELGVVAVGYNIRPRADAKTVSDETRRRISKTSMAQNRKMPASVKAALIVANHKRKGEARSPEWRAKTAATLRGRKRPPLSDEWKRKLSLNGKRRPVSCFTLDGQLVGTFAMTKDAAIALTNGRRCGISLCLNGHAKTAYGYMWKDATGQLK